LHKSFGGKFNVGAAHVLSAFSKYRSGASSDEHVLIGIISKAIPRANYQMFLIQI